MADVTVEAQAAIDAAKAAGNKVFKTTFNGVDVFYVRQISRLEYKNLATTLTVVTDQQQRMALHEEKVAELGSVFPKVTPEFLSRSAAGFVTVIADEILRLSGFTQDIVTVEV